MAGPTTPWRRTTFRFGKANWAISAFNRKPGIIHMRKMNDVASRLRPNFGLASLSAMAVMMATPALAQTEDAAQDDESVAAPTPASDDSIVVTGSRIRTVTPFNSPEDRKSTRLNSSH